MKEVPIQQREHHHRHQTILQIGLLYDRPEDYRTADGPDDRFAEFEPDSTIEAMEQAVLEAGHKPVRIGAPHRLLDADPGVDLIWNIGEGYGTRNREAWAPVLCEMRGIPCLGSDAYTLTVTLDKVLSKQIARDLGIPTTDWQVIPVGRSSVDPPELPFPLFCKPRYEGTAKGITARSVAHDEDAYYRQCRHLLDAYRQDVIIEPFLSGAELTCAVAGYPLRALPVMERGLHTSGIGSHAVDHADDQSIRTSDAITPELEHKLADWSSRISNALNIRDFARFDYKLNEAGEPMFLEVNPLPTFSVDSTFAILAELEDTPYPTYLSGILSSAIRRLNDS